MYGRIYIWVALIQKFIYYIYMEVFNYGLVLIRLYMHIYMYVWTYLYMGSFDTVVYIFYIYMEVFRMKPRDQTFIFVNI